MRKKIFLLIISCFLFTSCAKAEPGYSVSAGLSKPMIKQVTLAVVGDIMVHDYQYNEAYDPMTGTYDFMHNFQDVKKYFDGYDLVLGNLELTFGGKERGYSSYPCFNTPDEFLDAIKDAGFDILTTANNHSMDTGKQGLIRTLDKLDEYGIAHMGTYRSAEERDKILYKNVNGIKFAFLSYTYGTNGIAVPDAYLVNLIDNEQMVDDIKRARENADVVVVMPHLGNEYETYPKNIFQDWTDLMFLSGADIVLASHPHVLQPMEYVRVDHGDGAHDGFIIYSLGNFISSQTTPPRNASIVLHLTVEKVGNEPPNVKEVSFVPIWTQFRNAQEKNHFVVRSVYEMLTLEQSEKDRLLRKIDQARLVEVHEETASFLLNRKVPLSEIQEEYVFEK
ncbi:capsule biosynthesis protein CapA [Anaerotignum neopropionicum]|uniref:Capsule biosynthesis protein CapA n=1 Tax=Anaerotignum neopropionicum TaxID=36847 RepID=A0A136WI76_9FIRM|nr:CapA family protein [Anaerotignum neopropionicum]KXL54143.1 capsule biosynthesis protein CapA [Anaerotignum neopropionicum]